MNRILLAALSLTAGLVQAADLRVGIIGLDTSHAIAFATTLNQKKPADMAGVTVVAAYPKGSPDIESSTKRVPEYTEKIRALGIEIVDSIDALLPKVDAVLLETNDGRPHLEQLRPCLAAKKPVFIDKPIAGSLVDTIKIFAEAKAAGVPVFCSSSLRFGKNTVASRKAGWAKSAWTTSPCSLEATHPDLYWYGVHGCESLYAVMGTGCVSVKRSTTADGKIEVTGTWPEGRTGRYTESKKGDKLTYGGMATDAAGKEHPVGSYDGYDVLLVEIVNFFRSGRAPVSAEETTELYAFMEAADESKRSNGAEIKIADVIRKAQAAAK
jgi:predicted dehydrogenase